MQILHFIEFDMICYGALKSNIDRSSKLGHALELSTLGCPSTHNNTLQVVHENNWAPDLLSVLPKDRTLDYQYVDSRK
jgi:hypothetical protein